jgi:fructose-specific PTS system IIA-like component
VEQLLGAHHPRRPEPLLSEGLVILGSMSQTKEEVIHQMVDAFYVSGRTEDRDLVEEALWAREAVYSTGLGFGFATPHCKTDAVTADSICVLRLNEPIDWDSVDGEQVRMVVLLALRNSEAANTHMQVFSSLARKLMNDDFRQHLLETRTAEEMITYLADQLEISFGRLTQSPAAEQSVQSRAK